jgi:enoyl-CoA hydratase
MSDGQVRYERDGVVAHMVFDRPESRNAMTWQMYEQLNVICELIRQDPQIRVVTLRGVGGRAFIAGTDIKQFTEFASAEDGVRYEKRAEAFLAALDTLPVPTLAIVDGWCVGGGLAIAACCDLRVATPNARFGIPIARTLGNCLSIGNYARIVAEFGVGRAKRMLMLGDMLTADDAYVAGFVSAISEPSELDTQVAALVDRLSRNAPITMRVSKQAIARVLHAVPLDADDLLRECYGSRDFHVGVRAFIDKQEPQWAGR